MEDHVAASQDFTQAVWVANITKDEFHVARQIIGPPGWVHLRRQIIQDANLVASLQETVCQM
jgi:hypothetical protein